MHSKTSSTCSADNFGLWPRWGHFPKVLEGPPVPHLQGVTKMLAIKIYCTRMIEHAKTERFFPDDDSKREGYIDAMEEVLQLIDAVQAEKKGIFS